MAYLTVYAHDTTPELWATAKYTIGLGRLPDAIEPRVKQKVNGDWSLSLKYPIGGQNYSLLQMDRLICAEGQLYRIGSLEKQEGSSGRYLQVEAPHIMYDLQNSEISNIETSETDPDGITQETALALILDGTPFTVGTVDAITLDYLDILQKSSFWALKEQVLGLWGGELDPDNWTINIRSAVGSASRNYPIRRGRNIKGITYKETLDGLVTRLHVSGYGGATFEDINDGKDYIDSANISNYAFVREGRVEFPDDDLSADLMAKAVAHLATVDIPQVEYTIDLVSLKRSAEYALYAPLEAFNLGDTAQIHHDFFDVDISARAMELERDPVTGDNVRVVLGSYRKDLYKSLSDAAHAADTVATVTDNRGYVRGSKLRGAINTMVSNLMASGSYTNASVLGSQGYLLENTNEASVDYGAVYIGPNIIAFAKEKDGDNSWIWRTFGTGAGITADEITAGTLNAERLAVGSITEQLLSEDVGAAIQKVSEHQTTLETHEASIIARVQEIVSLQEAAAANGVSLTDLYSKYADVKLLADGLYIKVGSTELDDTLSDKITAIANIQAGLAAYKLLQEAVFSFETIGFRVGDPAKANVLINPDAGVLIADQNGVVTTQVSDSLVTVRAVKAEDYVQIGGFQFTSAADGRMSLKWLG